MQTKIRKAVFPVAGLGTRFLPATKAIPKEMLPIVDKPLIQYAVEEAVACGVTEIILVTGTSKRAIEDHFDVNFELETKLEADGKSEMLAVVRDILPRNVKCVAVRQGKPLGLGHAVLCAREIVGDEPFALLLPDDLMRGDHESILEQMLKVREKNGGGSVLALLQVARAETKKYGIVNFAESMLELRSGECAKISDIIEKPDPARAPSLFASMGRYILTSRVFEFLAQVKPGAIGEIQLTDGILQLLAVEDVYGYSYRGMRYDCGNKLGYLQAIVDYGQKHAEVGADFAAYLRQVVKNI